MNAIIVLLVIICLIAAVVWVLRDKRAPGRPRRKAARYTANAANAMTDTPTKPGGLEKLQANTMFWGVEIGQAGCEAAQALLGRQYTFDEAPQLPVEGCDSAMCTCQYKGLRDHRTMHRRKIGEQRTEVRFDNEKPDRRSRKQRRRGTDWKDHTY